jgi:glycosyltransferase involved in cell wall biosynthesis
LKILFVGMAESIHLARWVNQLDGTDWERYLFPVNSIRPHADLRNITYFSSMIADLGSNKALQYKYWTSFYFALEYFIGFRRWLVSSAPLQSLLPTTFRARALRRAIRQLKPDIVHSLEIQHAGYLTLEAKQHLKQPFPKWIVTNWGSDIYLFGRLSNHREKVRAILSACDYYSCECERDLQLAQGMGLAGKTLPVIPNTGGFDLDKTKSLHTSEPPSQRRLILIKGYQHWAGRALVALRALTLCADLLKGYRIGIYSASPDVHIAAELFVQETSIPAEIIPQTSHESMLRFYGQARLYIGLSISDAISTSLLEAMVMGAFPIQSCTACADEWIINGVSGLIVPPEDPDIVAQAIRRVLTDDDLVDRAAVLNARTAQTRLDARVIQSKALKMYEDIFREARG